MADFCSICDKKLGFLNKLKIKDGLICGECQNKSLNMNNCSTHTAQDYLDRFKYLEDSQELFSQFSPTIDIPNFLLVDENNRLFKIGKSKECFSFDELVNFELNEDGETLTKGGLGQAVIGGALLGTTGALLGGITGGKKTKTTIKNMYIRISLKNKWIKDEKITLIDVDTKKGGFLYNAMNQAADRIISALELIVNQQVAVGAPSQPPQATVSPADELLKYKQLLDMGALSQEEFDVKKKELLKL